MKPARSQRNRSPALKSSFSATGNISLAKTLAVVVAMVHGGNNHVKPPQALPNDPEPRGGFPKFSVTDVNAVAKLKII